MLDVNFTLVSKRANNWFQFGISLALGWFVMAAIKLCGAVGGKEYMAAFIGIIFYTIINTVVSIAHTSYMKYTVPSYYVYIFLVAILFLSAKFLSGVSIWNLEEYRMMFISISVFYIIASIAVRAIRYIFESAENDF